MTVDWRCILYSVLLIGVVVVGCVLPPCLPVFCLWWSAVACRVIVPFPALPFLPVVGTVWVVPAGWDAFTACLPLPYHHPTCPSATMPSPFACCYLNSLPAGAMPCHATYRYLCVAGTFIAVLLYCAYARIRCYFFAFFQMPYLPLTVGWWSVLMHSMPPYHHHYLPYHLTCTTTFPTTICLPPAYLLPLIRPYFSTVCIVLIVLLCCLEQTFTFGVFCFGNCDAFLFCTPNFRLPFAFPCFLFMYVILCLLLPLLISPSPLPLPARILQWRYHILPPCWWICLYAHTLVIG